jgi:excisionase family DNA binding protein
MRPPFDAIEYENQAVRANGTARQTMSLAEVADVLGVHRTTVWALYKRGELPIPVLKIGSRLRVVRAHLERFMEAGIPVETPGEATNLEIDD